MDKVEKIYATHPIFQANKAQSEWKGRHSAPCHTCLELGRFVQKVQKVNFFKL